MSIYVGIALGNIVTSGVTSWAGGKTIFLVEVILGASMSIISRPVRHV